MFEWDRVLPQHQLVATELQSHTLPDLGCGFGCERFNHCGNIDC